MNQNMKDSEYNLNKRGSHFNNNFGFSGKKMLTGTLRLNKQFGNYGKGEKISVEVMEKLIDAVSRKNEPRRDFLKRIIKDMHERGMLTESEILKSFKMYDTDGSGSISREEIRLIVKLAGEDLSENEIEEMIRESDIDGDGEVDFTEFISMILR